MQLAMNGAASMVIRTRSAAVSYSKMLIAAGDWRSSRSETGIVSRARARGMQFMENERRAFIKQLQVVAGSSRDASVAQNRAAPIKKSSDRSARARRAARAARCDFPRRACAKQL